MIMFLYEYARTVTDGVYDINNPADVDGGGDLVTLAQRISEDVEFSHKFKCTYNSNCKIYFNFELDGAQQTRLDTIVSTHKSKV